MERLEPVIRNRFWILTGVAMVIGLIGWWMASSGLAKTIDERQKAIEAAEKAIPAAGPSDHYTQSLKRVNAVQQKQVDNAQTYLWEGQVARMTWPENLVEFANKAGYRGEFAPLARDLYRTTAPAEYIRVWKKLNPFNPRTGEGIVVFPRDGMLAVPLPLWQDLPPTSEEMWDTQEDLWLLESLLTTICEVNGGPEANNRLDASIHAIQKLNLMGGTRSAGGEAADPSAGGADLMGGPGGESSYDPFGGSGGPGGGASTTGAAAPTTAEFLPKEEFGDAGTGAAGGMGGGSMEMTSSPDMSVEGDPSAGPAKPKIERYVDKEEDALYKTRGFYMVLVMDHRKVPDLLAELTSNDRSPWPVQIVRVQMVRLNDDTGAGSNATGGSGPGYGGGASPLSGLTAGSIMSAGSMGSSTGSGSFGGIPGGTTTGTLEEPMPMGGFNEFGNEMTGELDPTTGQARVTPAQAAAAALDNALQDPNIAQVAIAGLITIYKKPGEPAAEAAADPAADPAATTDPAATETPADPSAMPADPSAAPADPATGEPKASFPATPVEKTDAPAANPTGTPAATTPTAPGDGTTPAPAETPATPAPDTPETPAPDAAAPPAEPAPATPQ